MSDLDHLYQELILEHNKRPKNFMVLSDATSSAEGYNPLCGDRLHIYIQVKDRVVVKISFEGSGCAISKASASMMTEFLKGRDVDAVMELISRFNGLLTRKNGEVNDFGKLLVFQNIWKFPARVKCANLAWHAVEAALSNQQSVSTE